MLRWTAGFLVIHVLGYALPAAALNPPAFVLEWGSYGSGEGQFNDPISIAVDGDGNVFVADRHNHMIQKFDGDGRFLAAWGSQGRGDGQFQRPDAIAVGPQGNVFVGDDDGIQKFTGNGGFIQRLCDCGSRSLAVDDGGYIYVVWNNQVRKLDAQGAEITVWGGKGVDDGQFIFAGGVAVDGGGHVIVTDRDDPYRGVAKFNDDGTFVSSWDVDGGQAVDPIETATDAVGNIYVVEHQMDRISVFSPDGALLTRWTLEAPPEGGYFHPYDVAVGPDGSVYVTGSFVIRKFSYTTPVERVTWGRLKTRYPFAEMAQEP